MVEQPAPRRCWVAGVWPANRVGKVAQPPLVRRADRLPGPPVLRASRRVVRIGVAISSFIRPERSRITSTRSCAAVRLREERRW